MNHYRHSYWWLVLSLAVFSMTLGLYVGPLLAPLALLIASLELRGIQKGSVNPDYKWRVYLGVGLSSAATVFHIQWVVRLLLRG